VIDKLLLHTLAPYDIQMVPQLVSDSTHPAGCTHRQIAKCF